MTNTKSRKNGNSSEGGVYGDGQVVPVSPFICIEGRWYVIVQWRPDYPVPSPLTLRALSQAETQWLLPELHNAVADVWARMFPTDHHVECGGKTDE